MQSPENSVRSISSVMPGSNPTGDITVLTPRSEGFFLSLMLEPVSRIEKILCVKELLEPAVGPSPSENVVYTVVVFGQVGVHDILGRKENLS